METHQQRRHKMKEIKLNNDPATFTKAETKIMSQAKVVNAPIAVALRQNNQSWKLGPMGQTHRPKKQFVDLRTNQKISIGAARQILAKFEKQFAFIAKHEAMHQMLMREES